MFSVFDIMAEWAVFWMPIVLVFVLREIWLRYIQADYINKLDWVLLEIKFPREILKSPAAMEVILAALHQGADGNLIDKFWKGRVRAWFSLEVTSFEGSVHFYIRTEKKFKNLVETQIYSQYPGIEIYQVEDYTTQVPFGITQSSWDIFALEFELAKADPYPIKTYIDYGLDKEPSEAGFQVDPLLPVIEMMGNIKPGEQIWLQYLVMATRDRKHKPGTWFGKQGWKEEGKKLVDEIMKRDPNTKGVREVTKDGSTIKPMLSKGDQLAVEAIERNIAKLGFDVGIRMIYFGKEGVFDKVNVGSMIGCFKQFNSTDMNGFKPGLKTDFEYPWEDFAGTRVAKRKRAMLGAYRRRGYFFQPEGRKPLVLNSEELSTVFHFPGMLAQTPGLARIESKRAEPPVNLPI